MTSFRHLHPAWYWAIVAVLVTSAAGVAVLAVKSFPAPAPPTTVAYEQFRLTCCTSADVQQPWHPGQDFTLHWIVEDGGMTSDPTQHHITLTAVLVGPFASVAVLKTAGAPAGTLAATPLHVSNQRPGSPVSSIELPRGLPVGWYNLEYSVASGAHNRVDGASVIEVTSSGL